MDAMDHYRRLLAYDDWANREVAKALRVSLATPPSRSLSLLGHIIGAEWLWLVRLGAPAAQAVVWPSLTLDECQAELGRLHPAWERYLGALSTEGLAIAVTYVNSKGEQWSSRVADILMHVVVHSAYHRGQIAGEVRATGNTPAYTDFIHAVRTDAVR